MNRSISSWRRTRREFLSDVGRTALLASVGAGAARSLGLSTLFADEEPPPLSFGPLEPLVALMQETSADHLLPLLVTKSKDGTDLKSLVAAAALANARTFGGEDYVGFHTMMAIGPAYRMALASPEPRRLLPVLKVLYRNASRMQEVGGRLKEVLRQVKPGALPEGRPFGDALRDAVRAKDLAGSEALFAALAKRSPREAIDPLVTEVEDVTEVHRVVLPFRAFELIDVVGEEHAHTLLRQSLRYCVKEERGSLGGRASIRTVLPAVLAAHRIVESSEKRSGDDAWLEFQSQAIFEATPEGAAEVAASLLEKGYAPRDVGEAITLAANQLLLRDVGRTEKDARPPNKPVGSVHGDSIGVHACDSANAWRNLSRVTGTANQFACLVAGAYQVAYDRIGRGGDFLKWKPMPSDDDVAKVAEKEPDPLLRALAAAVESKDQAKAAAVVHRYGALGFPSQPVFDVLLRYATSEDGALHAEKYFGTATDEFASTRPAYRWRHAVALARVTASEYGTRAPGYEDACRLLGV